MFSYSLCFLKSILFSVILSSTCGGVLYIRTPDMRMSPGVEGRGRWIEHPLKASFRLASSSFQGYLRTSRDAPLCLVLRVSRPDKWWRPRPHCPCASSDHLFSNLLLFALQAAELGMVSAYYTYIFTNLVRHFHSPP